MASLDLKFIKKVWQIVAGKDDDASNNISELQESIFAPHLPPPSFASENQQFGGSVETLLLSCKIIGGLSLLFLHEEEKRCNVTGSNTNCHSPNNEDKGDNLTLSFLVSCMLATIKATAQLLQLANQEKSSTTCIWEPKQYILVLRKTCSLLCLILERTRNVAASFENEETAIIKSQLLILEQ